MRNDAPYASIGARHLEVERRHTALARANTDGQGKREISALRYRELIKLVTDRYGVVMPDDDAGWDDASIIVHHLAALSNPRKRIRNFAEVRAPWLFENDPNRHAYPTAPVFTFAAAILINDAIASPSRWTADRLAWRLRLRAIDRQRLGIKTIGCIEFSKADRQQIRKELDRERKAVARRAKGARPRKQYEACSDNRSQPWKELGISRATWFRKGKPMPETSPSAVVGGD